MHHYAWLPRSSGIQYLQRHEFNLPLAASWVLHISLFTSRTRMSVFLTEEAAQDSRAMVPSALSVTCDAVSCCGWGDFHLSHFNGQSQSVPSVYYFTFYLLAIWVICLYSHVHWITNSYFIQHYSYYVKNLEMSLPLWIQIFTYLVYLWHWEPWTAVTGHKHRHRHTAFSKVKHIDMI